MKPNPIIRTVALVLGFAIAAGASAAKPPLREVEHLREGLIAAGIVYELDRKCDRVDVRFLRGVAFLTGLKTHAEELGYSRAEIEAHVEDRAEKDRLEAIARDRLQAMGVVEDQPESYCTVALAEIERGSQIGRLLR